MEDIVLAIYFLVCLLKVADNVIHYPGIHFCWVSRTSSFNCIDWIFVFFFEGSKLIIIINRGKGNLPISQLIVLKYLQSV